MRRHWCNPLFDVHMFAVVFINICEEPDLVYTMFIFCCESFLIRNPLFLRWTCFFSPLRFFSPAIKQVKTSSKTYRITQEHKIKVFFLNQICLDIGKNQNISKFFIQWKGIQILRDGQKMVHQISCHCGREIKLN